MKFASTYHVLVFRDAEIEDHHSHEPKDAALNCRREGRLLWVDEVIKGERRTVLGVCEPCEKSPHFKPMAVPA